jgi:hypothetical protein
MNDQPTNYDQGLEQWLAQWEADWLAKREALELERDALADELREVYPDAARKIAELFERIAANDQAVEKLNGERPASVKQPVISVERHARVLDGLSNETRPLLNSVCLFDWETGRQICPPQRPAVASAFAPTMMPASDQRFTGEWWKDRQQAAERERAEQQRIADYYARQTRDQQNRENAEARERFFAHQPKNSG